MKDLAVRFNEDPHVWGVTGLVHDVDVELTKDNTEEHALITAGILREKKVENEIINAVLAHSGRKECDNLLEKTLFCVDPLTGFITACALMNKAEHSEKLRTLTVEFCMRRFKEKRFAQGAKREDIMLCSEIGISLEDFLDIGIKSMSSISAELGF